MTHSKIVLAEDVRPLDAPVKLADKKAAVKEVAVATTDGGKKVLIARGPASKGFVIRYEGGGELPLELRGLWLRWDDAVNAIRGYAAKAGSPVGEVQGPASTANTPGFNSNRL